ncbi:succinate dehydrogenase, hydrophobic membrane anchor protein [Cellulomonas fimi]|uniref:Succinate dehydrogenase hydrophobic membrane anchor subunit n=1 Tax=Cellulomonas fimi (strain ATCC 484 / DSM 20113 / JCM 1341 / CCUG 24087 / LMG 16345 / NBRC 15513 / NCIMB 8980 / NCTC 7547 / NRS-133) TaxID=590998 RepID=F4H830_CELFA|nr:succinate dehydrogenase, hydrophobic membrane anchor protein [Cellulomonas fimi]AEE46991.1 succinate dehydrogenase hydrophobic anchor subunit-like protein [Cellulomonas fimi ATCC 484]NNH07524.1 succinate dehydrogenase, hydrophobic membrane anchor protein [Cellulomonas fimi]VEH34785.1 succinate dehydrogenase cytochrome b556 small membrane subunit [Cellulomonas fimi]
MSLVADPKAPRPPKAGPGRRTTRGNTELYGWVFMRASGVLLVVLIFGHLFVNLVAGEGVTAIDFGFVAGKWASPFWQVWDLLMLWLAMIHGTNGMRTIVNDYAEKDTTRLVLKGLLYLAFVLVVVLGTLVIFTFDPCPTGSPADLLPSFCTA